MYRSVWFFRLDVCAFLSQLVFGSLIESGAASGAASGRRAASGFVSEAAIGSSPLRAGNWVLVAHGV